MRLRVEQIRMAPLYLAYVAFPISNMLVNYGYGELWRNWIDLAWVGLGICAVAVKNSEDGKFAALFKIFLVAMAIIGVGVIRGAAPWVTATMEAKPFIYLLLSIGYSQAFGLPLGKDFKRAGASLSVLLIAECLIRSVASVSLQRPEGSGEVNYDAALLDLALVFALSESRSVDRWMVILFLGVVASFSRTGLVAASVLLMFCREIKLEYRALLIAIAAIGAVMSALIRDLDLGSIESADRYWMWAVGLGVLIGDPLATLFNWTPGSPLDVEIPPYLQALWLDQQQKLDVVGIYPFHFHAMWLRLAIAWGWLPVVVGLIYAGAHSYKRPTRLALNYQLIVLLFGMTMGVFYLSNVGIPFFLAAFLVFSEKSTRSFRPYRRVDRPSGV